MTCSISRLDQSSEQPRSCLRDWESTAHRTGPACRSSDRQSMFLGSTFLGLVLGRGFRLARFLGSSPPSLRPCLAVVRVSGMTFLRLRSDGHGHITGCRGSGTAFSLGDKGETGVSRPGLARDGESPLPATVSQDRGPRARATHHKTSSLTKTRQQRASWPKSPKQENHTV